MSTLKFRYVSQCLFPDYCHSNSNSLLFSSSTLLVKMMPTKGALQKNTRLQWKWVGGSMFHSAKKLENRPKIELC